MFEGFVKNHQACTGLVHPESVQPGTSQCNSVQRLRRKPVPKKPYGFCGRYARHHVYLPRKARLTWRESRFIVKLPTWWSAELSLPNSSGKNKTSSSSSSSHQQQQQQNNWNYNWSRLNRRATNCKAIGAFLTRTDYPRCNLGLGKTNSLPLVFLSDLRNVECTNSACPMCVIL